VLPREKLRPADIVCPIDTIFRVFPSGEMRFSAREYLLRGYSRSIAITTRSSVVEKARTASVR
jgi:hypothetical protein